MLGIALTISAMTACGSSKPKPQPAEAAQPAEAEPTEEDLASAKLRATISEFCRRYTGVYCVHEAEDGHIKETTYDDMSRDEQDTVLSICEATWARASEPQREIMGHCVGCINDCGYTETCLTATSSGCLDFDEEDGETDVD
jgi:hypothetical protein